MATIKTATQPETILIIDCKTGIETMRELTKVELEQRELDALEIEQRQAEADAKLAARQSALAKLLNLGLTQDEIDAL